MTSIPSWVHVRISALEERVAALEQLLQGIFTIAVNAGADVITPFPPPTETVPVPTEMPIPATAPVTYVPPTVEELIERAELATRPLGDPVPSIPRSELLAMTVRQLVHRTWPGRFTDAQINRVTADSQFWIDGTRVEDPDAPIVSANQAAYTVRFADRSSIVKIVKDPEES